jgi:putative peptidoglycan lipid II flippase
LSLFAQALVPLLTRSFYALHNTKTPFYIALASEAVNIILVLLLIRPYGVFGLAIAFSAASVVNMAFLSIYLKKYFKNQTVARIYSWVVRIIIISAVTGFFIQMVNYGMDHLVNIDTFFGIFSQLVVSCAAGLLVFIGLCYFFNIEEFHYFKHSLKRRLLRVKEPIEEGMGEVEGI